MGARPMEETIAGEAEAMRGHEAHHATRGSKDECRRNENLAKSRATRSTGKGCGFDHFHGPITVKRSG